MSRNAAALGGFALLATLALSWDTLVPLAHAGDPFGESQPAADDPFGGSDLSGGMGGGFGQEWEAERERERGRQKEKQATPPDRQRDYRQQIVWAGAYSPAWTRIQKALDAPLSSVGLDFVDTPFKEVVDFLRSEYKLEIQIDIAALDDLGIGPGEPVTADLRNISLRSALRLMFNQLELTYLITDEVLLITTEEEAETRLTTAVYPVADLTNQGEQGDLFLEVLLATVAPDTWAKGGGREAEARMLPGGLLAVYQTQSVHEELIDVLTAIRRAMQL